MGVRKQKYEASRRRFPASANVIVTAVQERPSATLSMTTARSAIKISRRFHMIMRRTTPVLPIEPAEPLSRGIGGRIDPSTQFSLVLAEAVAHTSFLPAQDDDARVPLFADFRASPHIYLRRSRHHNPEPRTPKFESRDEWLIASDW